MNCIIKKDFHFETVLKAQDGFESSFNCRTCFYFMQNTKNFRERERSSKVQLKAIDFNFKYSPQFFSLIKSD